MSKKMLKLSPKYGANPCMPICFWCRKEKGEIVLLGKVGKGRQDIEAPKAAVMDIVPCPECEAKWDKVMNNHGILAFETSFDVDEQTKELNLVSRPKEECERTGYLTGAMVGFDEEKLKIFLKLDEPEVKEYYDRAMEKHRVYIEDKAFHAIFDDIVKQYMEEEGNENATGRAE